MRITVRVNTLGDLAGDMKRVAATAKRDMAKVVRSNAEQGNRLAKGFARESAGAHGKHYSKRFDAEAITALMWEYGPSGRPQGEMSFENGSRNQPPHNDLARSADIQGPKFHGDVAKLPDGWFW